LISIGFILAFIASGIPVTQLSLLMGADGVGIRFGLQITFKTIEIPFPQRDLHLRRFNPEVFE